MKVSYNWLKDYLECDLTPQQVADIMTAIGIFIGLGVIASGANMITLATSPVTEIEA